MTTVAQLIERLSTLPQEAEVEILTATEHRGSWETHIGVCFDEINLETDIEVSDHRDVDPERFPAIGGRVFVELGRNDS